MNSLQDYETLDSVETIRQYYHSPWRDTNGIHNHQIQHTKAPSSIDTNEKASCPMCTIEPFPENGVTRADINFPRYANAIGQPWSWWSLHGAWRMYALFVAGVAFAVGHHAYYSAADGQLAPVSEQTSIIRYGTLLAFCTKSCFVWAIIAALRQRSWTTLRDKSFTLEGVDSLLSAPQDFLAFFDLETVKKAKVATLLASFVW